MNRNVVRGVNPSGQPWIIADLRAEVSVDGHIRVKGKGLLLAGGNPITPDDHRGQLRRKP
ncbi:MAG: hypothetical protein M3N91_16020 [Pseudomonadota bacterium]|nr:hypothetical protein [Pseudomonadota bacterium]